MMTATSGTHTGSPQHTRPVALPVLPENIPTELTERPQWVLWRYTFAKGKWTKPPYNARTGRLASSTNRATWCTFDEDLAAYQAGGWDGMGYVPARDDPFVAGDLDRCRDRQTGALRPWAEDFLA